MKTRIPILLASGTALIVAPAAIALTGGAKYSGKTSDDRAVSLRLTSDATHIKRFHIRYTVDCDDDVERPATYTDVLNAKIRSDNTFRASGKYTGSGDGSTNTFKLTGTVFKRKAHGTFSLKAASADKSIHCTTGTLTWKAKKTG
jgi:hypothetical protein